MMNELFGVDPDDEWVANMAPWKKLEDWKKLEEEKLEEKKPGIYGKRKKGDMNYQSKKKSPAPGRGKSSVKYDLVDEPPQLSIKGSMRFNKKGELSPDDLARAVGKKLSTFSREHGGWIKTVTGLDTSVMDGYSILGEFLNLYGAWCKPGSLLLDCSQPHESWKFRNYHLVRVTPLPPHIEVLQVLERPRGPWAPMLWPTIEKELGLSQKNRMDYVEGRVRDMIMFLEAEGFNQFTWKREDGRTLVETLGGEKINVEGVTMVNGKERFLDI